MMLNCLPGFRDKGTLINYMKEKCYFPEVIENFHWIHISPYMRDANISLTGERKINIMLEYIYEHWACVCVCSTVSHNNAMHIFIITLLDWFDFFTEPYSSSPHYVYPSTTHIQPIFLVINIECAYGICARASMLRPHTASSTRYMSAYRSRVQMQVRGLWQRQLRPPPVSTVYCSFVHVRKFDRGSAASIHPAAAVRSGRRRQSVIAILTRIHLSHSHT